MYRPIHINLTMAIPRFPGARASSALCNSESILSGTTLVTNTIEVQAAGLPPLFDAPLPLCRAEATYRRHVYAAAGPATGRRL